MLKLSSLFILFKCFNSGKINKKISLESLSELILLKFSVKIIFLSSCSCRSLETFFKPLRFCFIILTVFLLC